LRIKKIVYPIEGHRKVQQVSWRGRRTVGDPTGCLRQERPRLELVRLALIGIVRQRLIQILKSLMMISLEHGRRVPMALA
jgi:hypothetical protein